MIMKKIAFALGFIAMALLTGCSTSENGVSVGEVYNSDCSRSLNRSAYADDDERDFPEDYKMVIKLTREGNIVSGEIINYSVNCAHGELYVDCQQTGKKLDVNVRERILDSDGIRANCLCWVNVYFTLYNVEGDTFQLTLDGQNMGEISFMESNMVEIGN